jgi:small subunit ribosomal protein S25e
LGGGKKKRSIKQMVKSQSGQKEKSKSKKSKTSKVVSGVEKKNLRIIPPNPTDEKVKSELRKMKVLTPYIVASRFNINLGVARDFLKDLCHQGLITFVSSSRKMKIYKNAE